MKINHENLVLLALALSAERKRQKLSREALSAVCGVSTSFIRDAESSPENCSLGNLAKLINGLGLSIEVRGLELVTKLEPVTESGPTPSTKTAPRGRAASATRPDRADFSVPDSQLVGLAAPIARHGIKPKSKGTQP